MSFVGDAKQFVRRYVTTLHLSLWTGLTAEFDYFNRVRLSRVEDAGT
jgi:hypothetical protein